jgi:hypothetical protein
MQPRKGSQVAGKASLGEQSPSKARQRPTLVILSEVTGLTLFVPKGRPVTQSKNPSSARLKEILRLRRAAA